MNTSKIFSRFLFNTKNFSKYAVISTSIIGLYKYKYSTKVSLSLEEEFKKFSLSGYESLQEGEMREFKYGTQEKESILILKYDGQLRALSNYCTHFGAPMHTGVLIDRVVKCPWHGASFDVVTGKTDISPSLDGLDVFDIVTENDALYVKLPTQMKNKKLAEMAKRDLNNTKKYVIIGGGAAALSAAETLRQSGYTGEITIISEENTLPYDRTMLSKFVPPTIEKLHLRGKQFFEEYGIDILNGHKAVSVNNTTKTVKLENGSSLHYDKLLIASGSSADTHNIKGLQENKKNIHLLRTYEDAVSIQNNCKTKKNIVITGGSFIALELASFIKKANKEAEVTLVIRAKSPFEKELGTEVGNILKKLHEENGVKFILENEISEISGQNSIASKLTLSKGSTIECDMLVLGLGSKPNTEIVSDLVTMDGNHIKTNLFMQTSDKNIFCAGDVCSIPFIHNGIRYKFGHWVAAQQQGAISALNMLDKNVAYDYVPYYWTRMWDKTLQFTGNASNFDEVYIDGDISKYTFVAYYFNNGNVVGCASMNVPNATNIMYEAFKSNIVPKAYLIKDGTVTLKDIKTSLSNVKNRCSRSTCACFSKH